MTQTGHNAPMGAIIVSVKLASLLVSIALAGVLIYCYAFQWYTALALGVVAYIVGKVTIAVSIGLILGRQDAREMKQQLANLSPECQQDIIDNGPADVRDRVENVRKNLPPTRRSQRAR